jgi:hypothetical protein
VSHTLERISMLIAKYHLRLSITYNQEDDFCTATTAAKDGAQPISFVFSVAEQVGTFIIQKKINY